MATIRENRNENNKANRTVPVIKDAAVGKGVFTLVDREGKHYIHYNLPEGYLLFAVKDDDALAVEVNNYLADVLEAEHGKATRAELEQWATAKGQSL
jgi:hypothetical protein